jgi:hypothetical protein
MTRPSNIVPPANTAIAKYRRLGVEVSSSNPIAAPQMTKPGTNPKTRTLRFERNQISVITQRQKIRGGRARIIALVYRCVIQRDSEDADHIQLHGRQLCNFAVDLDLQSMKESLAREILTPFHCGSHCSIN